MLLLVVVVLLLLLLLLTVVVLATGRAAVRLVVADPENLIRVEILAESPGMRREEKNSRRSKPTSSQCRRRVCGSGSADWRKRSCHSLGGGSQRGREKKK